MLLICGGTIHNAIDPAPFKADILIENGKIVKLGAGIEAYGAEIYNADGFDIYPGFIDAHCHTGLDGFGIGYERQDFNELNDPITPQLRAIDGIQPMDPTLKLAVRAGVTTVCTGPGSANVIGGTFAAIKTVGDRVDDMIVKYPVAMKCAFGENPKRCYQKNGISSRMSTAARLREMLFKAKEYGERRSSENPPAFDMKLEALQPVINGEIPLKAHAHSADDLFTAIRIAKEFGVRLTLEHCTEGHLAADKLAAEGYPMAVGPSLTHATKFELKELTFETAGILSNAGGQVSIVTDAPWVPQQYLALCAGLAVKSGMDRFKAIQAITINPAKHIGIEDRVGSVEVGKDADLVIVKGDPLSTESDIAAVFVDGKKVE